MIQLDAFQIVMVNESPTINDLVFQSAQVINLLHQMVLIVSYFVRMDNLSHSAQNHALILAIANS